MTTEICKNLTPIQCYVLMVCASDSAVTVLYVSNTFRFWLTDPVCEAMPPNGKLMGLMKQACM